MDDKKGWNEYRKRKEERALKWITKAHGNRADLKGKHIEKQDKYEIEKRTIQFTYVKAKKEERKGQDRTGKERKGRRQV